MVSSFSPPDASKLRRGVNYIAAQFRIQRKRDNIAMNPRPIFVEKKEMVSENEVKVLLEGFEEKLNKFDMFLDEINNDVMTAMAEMENCKNFDTKIRKVKKDISERIDGVKKDISDRIDGVAADFDESQHFTEARIDELAENVDTAAELFDALTKELEQRRRQSEGNMATVVKEELEQRRRQGEGSKAAAGKHQPLPKRKKNAKG